ncbi:MAG: hypothetical protein ACREKB_17515 [Candidatus Rokuibacteriota bacterium]
MTPPRKGKPTVNTMKEGDYCAYCGTDLDGAAQAPKRFAEPFCSNAHADAFAQEARATRLERATSSDPTSVADSPGGPSSSRWDL